MSKRGAFKVVFWLLLVLAVSMTVHGQAEDEALISDAGVGVLARIGAVGLEVGTTDDLQLWHIAPRWVDEGRFCSLDEWRILFYEVGFREFVGLAMVTADGACSAWVCLDYARADGQGWLWYEVRLTDAARRVIGGGE